MKTRLALHYTALNGLSDCWLIVHGDRNIQVWTERGHEAIRCEKLDFSSSDRRTSRAKLFHTRHTKAFYDVRRKINKLVLLQTGQGQDFTFHSVLRTGSTTGSTNYR